jgi:hypothetical protein
MPRSILVALAIVANFVAFADVSEAGFRHRRCRQRATYCCPPVTCQPCNQPGSPAGCSASVDVETRGRSLRIHGEVNCGCDCDIDITLNAIDDQAEVSCDCNLIRFKVRATRVNDTCIKLETKVAGGWQYLGRYCL